MLEILGKTNFDFMGKRYLAFAFSGIMAVLGIVAIVQISRGAANLGIDFSGGTAVQLKFDQAIRIDESQPRRLAVRGALVAGDDEAGVVGIGDEAQARVGGAPAARPAVEVARPRSAPRRPAASDARRARGRA